jgi:hypothetical protein
MAGLIDLNMTPLPGHVAGRLPSAGRFADVPDLYENPLFGGRAVSPARAEIDARRR